MDQSSATQSAPDHADAPEDQFTRVAKAGWNGFTRFLLLNVVVIIVALLIIGLFTVWS
jgi:hypothetical protein